MSDFDDDEPVHSGTSVLSIGEDYQDPQVQHLIVGEDCCRAIYRSIEGVHYICPRKRDECHKRNHVRLRVTSLGEVGIFEIHRGIRGGFRGVYAHCRLSEADHHILLKEARDRNRVNAAVAAGRTGVLVGNLPPAGVVEASDLGPPADPLPPEGAQTPAELMAMIAQLQSMLAASTMVVPPPPGEGTPPVVPPATTIPPAIHVTAPSVDLVSPGGLGVLVAPAPPVALTQTSLPALSVPVAVPTATAPITGAPAPPG
jgi:hypothetical protein